MLLGAGMGHFREEHQKKLLQQQNEAQLFHDIATKHPEVIMQSPEMQKSFKKFYGDDALGLVMGVGQMRQQAQQQAGGLFREGGAQAPQQAPAGGAPNPMMTAPTIATPGGPSTTSISGPVTGDAGFRQQAMAALQQKGITDPSQQQAILKQMGLPVEWAGGSATPVDGTPSDLHPAMGAIWDKHEELQRELDQADKFMSEPGYQELDEGQRRVIEHRYDTVKQRLLKLEDQMTEPERAAAKARAEIAPTVEKEKALAPVKTGAKVAEEKATRPEKVETVKETKAAELGATAAAPKTPREVEAERKTTETEHKDLYAEGEKILSDAASTTKDTTKMKPQVDAYNQRVVDFHARNPSFGHPRFLVYSETPGKLYGKTAKVEFGTPTHVIKNKSGQVTGYQLPDGSIIRPSS
jgi:hypothetical protein